MLTKYVPNLESQDSRLELEYNRGRNTLKAFFFFFLSKRFNNVYECGPKPIKVPSRLCYSIIKSNNNKCWEESAALSPLTYFIVAQAFSDYA